MKQQTTLIQAKSDLYNSGKCFTKGELYRVEKPIHQSSSLMDATVVNDLGEDHLIGSWWREFDIIDEETETDED